MSPRTENCVECELRREEHLRTCKRVDVLEADNDRLRVELAQWTDIADKRMEAGLRVQTQLTELREAVEAVTRGVDSFEGAQYDVTDSIAYVDNMALKNLRAVLAKTTT